MPDIANARLGQTIRSVREGRGLSQQVVATRAEVATRTLARLERGEGSTVGTLVAIAAALDLLDMSLAELLTEVAA